MTEDNCKKKECMITGENARRPTAFNSNKSLLPQPLPFLLFLQLKCNAAAIYISNKESFFSIYNVIHKITTFIFKLSVQGADPKG